VVFSAHHFAPYWGSSENLQQIALNLRRMNLQAIASGAELASTFSKHMG
jgi:hypothetical protein